ncbi:MAG TPA: glucosamine-6-phosphate deaminase [Rhodothermales bacterium]|nr:glucosamine-6-phosphate deaminase [Rhodothermales bacterium]
MHQTLPVGEGAQRERLPVLIFEASSDLAAHVARRIANLIMERRALGQKVVLGLPTGSTPIGVYRNLIRFHKEAGLDLSNVVTFNLDEYYPMDPGSLQSYHRFMRENFFDHVNIPEENIHIPRGDIRPEEVETHCLTYEHAIQKAGGLDLVLLGIGRTGHIGFNEPGSSRTTRTRLIALDEITIKDAASDFFGDENVPRTAITMGVGTILDAREVILMATGEHKAPIVRRAVEEEPTKDVTASYLQFHRNAAFYVDRASASELTRVKTPWLVMPVEWTLPLARRAVIWLSETLGKAILRLDAGDFFRHHLADLAHAYGTVDALCQQVFEDLRRRIADRERLPKGERIILFSPHPDDDVISAGGMLDKLAQNGNEITVAYMTNGSVAVFDADVRRHLLFSSMSVEALGVPEEARQAVAKRRDEIEAFLASKMPGEIDTPEVQELKARIRYSEAIAGIEVMGLSEKNARFLDMPFYQTGTVRKNPIGEADIQVVLDLLEEIKPAHVYVAGDLSDPHGTHQMCYVAIREALRRYNGEAAAESGKRGTQKGRKGRSKADEAGGDGAVVDPNAPPRPLVWLYRGAWQEWEIDRADVLLPLSRADLDRKIQAIYKHESQKDRAMFPGAYDDREFWQRARDRNTGTADALNRLGLPEFYAAEAYVTTYEME